MVAPCVQNKTIREIQLELIERGKQDVLQSEQILNMKEKIDDTNKKIGDVDTKLDAGLIMIAKKIDDLEKKFASKWVEWIMKGIIGIIGVAVFGAMVADVLKK